MSLAQNEDFLKAAFRGYDKNGDGKVTREEFKRVMLRTRSTRKKLAKIIKIYFLSNCSDEKIEAMLAKADVDKSG